MRSIKRFSRYRALPSMEILVFPRFSRSVKSTEVTGSRCAPPWCGLQVLTPEHCTNEKRFDTTQTNRLVKWDT